MLEFFFHFFAIPLLELLVSLFTLWVPTLHTEGLQQPEVSSVQPASLRLRWVFMCLSYLYVSGPLDFRLVIQVLLGPRMILNACARRPDLGLTSHPNDAALPHLVTHKATAAQCPGRGLNPGRCRESP